MKYSHPCVTALISCLHLVLAAPCTNDWTTKQWDVIVVGAGPAGIIVADRLSETGKSVLLLEAGGPSYGITGGTERPDWLSATNLSRVDVPGLYTSIFSTPTNLTCGGATNAFGGCTIGGSSAINAGLFFEPPASDFDTYFPAGWKHADLAPSIARLYAMQPASDITSQDGQLYLQSGYDAARTWLVDNAGFAELDINANADNKTGVFGHPVYDYSNGQRGGPVTTYLQAALARPSFRFESGVRVHSISRNGATATGVVATITSSNTTLALPLAPSGRVILSGGALQSPQLLMLSGIGDPAVLSRLAAAGKLAAPDASAWINNTAVGAGLFDNPNTFIELSSPNVSAYAYSYAAPDAADADLYLSQRAGPYSFASELAVFWDTVAHADGSVAGMQGTLGSAGYADYTNATTLTLNIYGTSGLASSGAVVLDADFIPGPDADVYYSAPQDALDIATFIRRIFDALPADIYPLNIARDASVEEIRTYITTWSAYARGQVNHWSSSCRLGECVDAASATVLGTENVHVVDASIVAPLTVNPQMGVMIAAERAAELIKSVMAGGC